MVVEQRIGRVDRIGQRAEKIVVLNFAVADSIEEQIVSRLLEKIGVFRDSIGEFDEIVGDVIEDLTEKALAGRLTGPELEQELRRAEDALARKVHDARRMLARVDSLLAATRPRR